jgi:hypothetical protein
MRVRVCVFVAFLFSILFSLFLLFVIHYTCCCCMRVVQTPPLSDATSQGTIAASTDLSVALALVYPHTSFSTANTDSSVGLALVYACTLTASQIVASLINATLYMYTVTPLKVLDGKLGQARTVAWAEAEDPTAPARGGQHRIQIH